ncbi:hypothetical protein [uncultured Thiohalocapsa sp.]|uniref:hypothetical protein n=1 Tax=uncultured Thiohalocapsa sp. TaxID=768990 RepID=UPI0025F5DAF2|nr:hypothetical protein [uncultured Thiohalocapsa sp.]
MGQAVPLRLSPVLIRAAVWSLIGMIYTPLYLVLRELLAPALDGFAGVAAAAAAGGIGAVFYGARQLALTASVIGTGCAVVAMAIAGADVGPWRLSLAAALLSLAVGFLVQFPHRCTADVGIKALAGLATGAFSAALLLAAEHWLAIRLPPAADTAFLVSVTGVLYVSVLVARPVRVRGRGRFCNVSEGLVIAVIAVAAANGLAAFAGIFAVADTGALTNALLRVTGVLPAALVAAMFAGAVAGGLLELFEFDWVDRV